MTKPEAVAQAATAFNTVTTPKETAEITVKAGDILVAGGIGADTSAALSISAVEGGGLTWTSQKVLNTTSNAYVRVWTATAAEGKSFNVKFTKTQSGGNVIHWGGEVQVWRKSSGIGEVASVTNTEGAPSLSITTKSSSSAIAMFAGDWAAKTGAATYRTGAGTFTQKTHVEDGEQYTLYGGYYAEAGAAGAYTIGMTAPTGQKFSIVAVEIKGEESGGTKGEAAVAKVLAVGPSGSTKRAAAASVGLDIVSASSPAPLRKQTAAVAIELALGLSPGAVRRQIATVGVARALGAEPGSKRLSPAAVGVLAARALSPAGGHSLTAAVAALRAIGAVPGTMRRQAALGAQIDATAPTPSARRILTAAVSLLRALVGAPSAARSQTAPSAAALVVGIAPSTRRAATAAAVLTRWRALNPVSSVLVGIPNLILPLVALFISTKNTATFTVDKNTATFTAATNDAVFDLSVNVAAIETSTNTAEIKPADANTATIGS